MNFVHKKYLIGDSAEISILQVASERLYKKLKQLEANKLDISEYSKVYLTSHQLNLKYLFQMYTFIIYNLIKEIQKPFHQIVVIDHGGGIGILSLLCKELGMIVVHNDIYKQVVNDARTIANEIKTTSDFYHHGSVKELADFCNKNNLIVDGVISSEVIEHIYNIKEFLADLELLPSKNLHFVFSTSANIRNPIRRNKLMKMQYISEYVGHENFKGRKNKDSLSPFFKIRENIIREHSSELTKMEVTQITTCTRGMNSDDVIKAIIDFKESAILPVINHQTNTCDPITGNWVEHLMEPEHLQEYLDNRNCSSEIKSGFYSIGNDNFFVVFIKNSINVLIKLFGNKSIYFSHYWMLISKNSSN